MGWKIVICAVFLFASVIAGDDVAGLLSLKYIVCFTTIPPRFRHIHQTIQSWLQQSIPPQTILIFVPAAYKRFRRKEKLIGYISHATHLADVLKTTLPTEMAKGRIEVVETRADWGPATKFLGSLLYQQRLSVLVTLRIDVDYWMYCDDDVQYREDVARYYSQQIDLVSEHHMSLHAQRVDTTGLPATKPTDGFQKDGRYDSLGYTLFAAEKRLHFSLSHEISARHVSHIQGVDSYLVPSSAFGILTRSTVQTAVVGAVDSDNLLNVNGETKEPRASPLSNVTNIVRIVEHYHTHICPESYYQDDYMVSFLLNLAGVDMLSIRDPCAYGLITAAQLATTPVENDLDICKSGLNLVVPIPGVTKEHNQMHLKEEVFVRESITQRCLMDTANDAYKAIYTGD
jgi:hypothetical protein